MSKIETKVIASRMRSKWLKKLGFEEIHTTFKSVLIYPYYIIQIYHTNKWNLKILSKPTLLKMKNCNQNISTHNTDYFSHRWGVIFEDSYCYIQRNQTEKVRRNSGEGIDEAWVPTVLWDAFWHLSLTVSYCLWNVFMSLIPTAAAIVSVYR